MLIWLIDATFAFGILWLAGNLLLTPDPFKAVVLFIAFGLLMSLVWVRLQAPDLALAEAAIGAGITGALLLSVLSRVEGVTDQDLEEENADRT